MGNSLSYADNADALDFGGVNGAISVSTSAVLAIVGGSALSNRKTLTIYNNGTLPLYMGYSSAVTTTNGTPIAVGQAFFLAVGPNTTVYLIAASGTHNVRLGEIASV